MAIPVVPFIVGLAVGALSTLVYKDERTREKMRRNFDDLSNQAGRFWDETSRRFSTRPADAPASHPYPGPETHATAEGVPPSAAAPDITPGPLGEGLATAPPPESPTASNAGEVEPGRPPMH